MLPAAKIDESRWSHSTWWPKMWLDENFVPFASFIPKVRHVSFFLASILFFNMDFVIGQKTPNKMHFWEITFQSQQKTFNQWQPWGKVHLHFSVNTHRHSPHGRQNEQTFLQLRFWRIECFVLDEHRTTSQGQIIWINFDSNKRSFLWQVNFRSMSICFFCRK